MKKYVKLLSLPILTLMLVACGNQNKPAEETTTAAPEATTVAETTGSQVSTPNDTTTVANESTEEGEETQEGETTVEGEETQEGDETEDADVAATDVKFTLYVDGEETANFVAKDAVEGSVIDAMTSIEELEFNFNEDEGIIDVIDGIENDYETGKTWVYLLNGEYAEFGVVSQTLSEGDTVEWYYGFPEGLPVNIIPE
ncbi:DUF4430 domain-containing protein [Globicatella sp. PHS-GS-PNBC-21-1553]|uniref:DUF4430 domain-containing protein n=1 Tax=Globicatella sp. PHS-GS-PNBC-21-1553 TaxID=2885764 RepID=UPI00298F3C07|nr:DUF4430 domain-containing protein [Globicatella sp. PHS-GS-PNBC-21-1553]WPC08890.1 DUF4430 domain-containing protein [Globicatella sp. PHS-GS-PNBC-21-1553]